MNYFARTPARCGEMKLPARAGPRKKRIGAIEKFQKKQLGIGLMCFFSFIFAQPCAAGPKI